MSVSGNKAIYKLQKPLSGKYATDGFVEVLAYKEGHENQHIIEMYPREVLKLFRGRLKVYVRVSEYDGCIAAEELDDVSQMQVVEDQDW